MDIQLKIVNIDHSKAPEQSDIFDMCRRIALRARYLAQNHGEDAARHLLMHLGDCRYTHHHDCPRKEACDRYFGKQILPLTDNASNIINWDTLERRTDGAININGSSVGGGFEDLFTCRDSWGNTIWHQRLSTDIARKYDVTSFRTLLDIWQQKSKPGLGDFDVDRLDSLGILPWLHVFDFNPDGQTYFRRYAPNMVEYSGRDCTNTLVQEFELRPFADLLEKVQSDVVSSESPKYSFVARRLRLDGGRRQASMRRLELPYFDNGRVAGSLVLLHPEAA